MSSSNDPRFQEAFALYQNGRLTAAQEICEAILGENADHPEAVHLLGVIHHQRGDQPRAAALLERAVALALEDLAYRYNLAVVLQKIGRLEEAETCYRRVVAHDPANLSTWVNLGNLLCDTGQFGEACDCHRNALRLQPDGSKNHLLLARSLRLMGEIESSLSHLGIAVTLAPDDHQVHSALLFTSQYEPGIQLAELDRRHRDWAALLAPKTRSAQTRTVSNKPPFRVGFLSPDLGIHPVGIFLAPLLERLRDQPEIETICFNDREIPDEFTLRNRAAANDWAEIAGLSDDELFELLDGSSLDVLVELTGHTDQNRLPVVARRPAPVQMSWAGYVGTTGLDSIDYLITDAFHSPDGSDQHYSETLLRFPHDYIPWEPPLYAPEPGPLPLIANGFPTFGCLNNPAKLTAPTLRVWATLLRALPDARLILKYLGMDDRAVKERVLGLFAVFGVAPDRIEMLGQTQHRDHLSVFQRIDVALDPTPYSGGLSTCESVWMGVPVVTCPGDTFASRHSLSHLNNAGLPDTVVDSPEAYVKKAIELVSDADALADRRSSMRSTVAASPLCDLDRFAADFIAAIRVVNMGIGVRS